MSAIFNSGNLISVLLTLLSIPLLASEYKKEFSKTYPIDASALVELNTSFTHISLQNWDKNEVEIFVFVTVDAASEEKANKIFEQIKIDLIGNRSKVEVKTNIGDQNSKTGHFTINVQIKAPKSVSLKAKNSFGDISIADLDGRVEITNDYGKISTASLSAIDNQINCTFGSIALSRFGGGQIEGEFGNIKVEEIQGNTTLNSEYGEVEINNVEKTCQSLQLHVSFGNCSLKIAENANFSIKATVNMGNAELSGKITVKNNENNWGSSSTTGILGDGSGTIEVNCNFGNASISTK